MAFLPNAAVHAEHYTLIYAMPILNPDWMPR